MEWRTRGGKGPVASKLLVVLIWVGTFIGAFLGSPGRVMGLAAPGRLEETDSFLCMLMDHEEQLPESSMICQRMSQMRRTQTAAPWQIFAGAQIPADSRTQT